MGNSTTFMKSFLSKNFKSLITVRCFSQILQQTADCRTRPTLTSVTMNNHNIFRILTKPSLGPLTNIEQNFETWREVIFPTVANVAILSEIIFFYFPVTYIKNKVPIFVMGI